MAMTVGMADLMEYTDWERQKWKAWLTTRGDSVLGLNAGPHGDGRFDHVGDLIKHIFSAEKRYVDRLSDRPLTDPATIPADRIEALFGFGQRSREDLRSFIDALPESEWDVAHEYNILKFTIQATPRKIIVHVLTHEIRHWAQIATVLRFNGLITGEMHDFLVSPALSGGHRAGP